MNLTETRKDLERLRRERREVEVQLRLEKEIEAERDRLIKARVKYDLRHETLEQKAEREEFQRKLAIYASCPEIDPNGDWRNMPLTSPKAHRGGSES